MSSGARDPFGIEIIADRCVRPLGKPRSRLARDGIFRFCGKSGTIWTNEPELDAATTTMESPDHHTETQTDASEARKRRRGEENDVPPSPVSHTGNARSRRPLALIGGAHDARTEPHREIHELSDGERDALRRAELALQETQPPAPKVAGAPSDRKRRAAALAEARGHAVVDVDAHAAAAVAAASAPEVKPSRAGLGATYSKDPTKWTYYEHDDQIDHDRRALQKIDMGGGRSGLDALIDGANKIGRLFFDKFDVMVAEKVCSAMRLGALTRTPTTTLSGKALRIDLYERKLEDGPHVAVYQAMAKIFREDLGVVAGASGRVEGVFATFAVAGDYGGYDDHVTKMTEASSLFHKGLIQGATTGRVDRIIYEGVNCNFARRTIESADYGGIANDKRGNFGSNARDGAPLVLAQIDPRQQRFGMRTWLQKGALSEEAYAIIGVTGTDTNAAAHASGVVKVCIVSLAGYDAAALSLNGITNHRAPPARTAELRYSRFQDTLALCCAKQPHLYAVYEALWRLGVAEEPNSSRNPWKCLRKPFDAMSKWASAESALTRAFSVCLGDGAKLLATTKDFKNIQEWEKHWSCTSDLLDHAGVGDVSELVHVSGDASGGAVIGQCRPHYVPLDTTMLDAHGEHVHKPKRARLGTGNGPVEFTCHRCGHTWNPDPESIRTKIKPGRATKTFAVCKCDTEVKPPT